jgi:hypothetical protein
MEGLSEMSHGNERTFIQLIKSRGLAGSYADAHQLADAYKNDPNTFDSDGVYSRAVRRNRGVDAFGRGQRMTPKIPQLLNKIEDIGGTQGDKGIDFVADQVKQINEKGIGQYSKEAFGKMTDSVSHAMKSASEGMVKAVREELKGVGKDMVHSIKQNVPFMHD